MSWTSKTPIRISKRSKSTFGKEIWMKFEANQEKKSWLWHGTVHISSWHNYDKNWVRECTYLIYLMRISQAHCVTSRSRFNTWPAGVLSLSLKLSISRSRLLSQSSEIRKKRFLILIMTDRARSLFYWIKIYFNVCVQIAHYANKTTLLTL